MASLTSVDSSGPSLLSLLSLLSHGCTSALDFRFFLVTKASIFATRLFGAAAYIWLGVAFHTLCTLCGETARRVTFAA
jgi:hypothetical protein